jgi:hypothetical protein
VAFVFHRSRISQASGRFYEVRGQATYGCLLTNLLSVKGVVPPEGFVWCGMDSIQGRFWSRAA